jgi:Glycosyl transferase 4-like domain/Glycosyl transferases group 1
VHAASTVGVGLSSRQAEAPCARYAAILRGLPGVSVNTDSARPAGAVPERSVGHILLVAYLYPPCNAVSAHRPAGLRRAFESAGVRTTVLTSEISGSYDDDDAQRILRAGDLRTRFSTQYQTLVGYRDGPLEARGKPRWWTNYIVPDPTAVSWFPQALVQLLRLIRKDRPDVVVTTSGPESSHLLGLVACAAGIRWVADYRDGWLRDVRHAAPLRVVDRVLERQIARRSTIVTAVNDAIAAEVAQRHGVRAVTISNGFDQTAIADASDERASLDSTRFSLVYTGLFAIDVGEQPVVNRGRDAQTFLAALATLAARDTTLADRFELVVAGPISERESALLTGGELRSVVRVLGWLPRNRALGLQQAADGLLLVPGGAGATTAKVFEYLAARKPIFAVTQRDGVAATLLREAGEHTIAEPGDVESLADELQTFVQRWASDSYQPRHGFDLDAYEYGNLGKKLLQLLPPPGSACA